MARMSRKDFEEIAETVRQLPADEREAEARTWADRLAGTNRAFDRERFIAAATRPVDGTVLMNGHYYPAARQS